MIFDSSAKIPEMPGSGLEKLPEEEDYKQTEQSPNYFYTAHPNLSIVVQVVGSRGL